MTAKRVSSAKRAKEQATAEQRLREARTLIETVLLNCEENPPAIKATTVETWRQIFLQIQEALR